MQRTRAANILYQRRLIDALVRVAMPLIPDKAAFQNTLANLPLVTYQPGETVIVSGSKTGRLLILKKGAVAIVKENTEIAKVAEPPWHKRTIEQKTAIFRQINKDKVAAHHDALEFPDGQIVLLTCLREGQEATVLQLPAEPRTAVEVEAQRRAAFVG
jgi:hypothetical protein